MIFSSIQPNDGTQVYWRNFTLEFVDGAWCLNGAALSDDALLLLQDEHVILKGGTMLVSDLTPQHVDAVVTVEYTGRIVKLDENDPKHRLYIQTDCGNNTWVLAEAKVRFI